LSAFSKKVSSDLIIGAIVLTSRSNRELIMRRMGIGRSGTGMFGSMSSMFGDNSLNYYCMSCGTKHKAAACPKCGSKMKRVGS
jgi:hypothetical protein